ncbi:MAG: hypothetical protein PHU85_05950 [Phycisphaerae bacterium]|nr:hypothetical protein [Phycisphaerae bacterium]
MNECESPLLAELKQVHREQIESADNQANRFHLVPVRKCLDSAVARVALKTPRVPSRLGRLYAVRLKGFHLHANVKPLVGDDVISFARSVVIVRLRRTVSAEEGLDKLTLSQIPNQDSAKARRRLNRRLQLRDRNPKTFQKSGHADTIGTPARRC